MIDPQAFAVSAAQHRLMHLLWHRLGVSDRAQRLALTGRIVGRDVPSSTTLTWLEASAVIEALNATAGKLESFYAANQQRASGIMFGPNASQSAHTSEVAYNKRRHTECRPG